MRRLQNHIETVVWRGMDLHELNIGASEFQAIVDEGSLDCLIEVGRDKVLLAMSEISRVIKKRGVFVCLGRIPPTMMHIFFDRPADPLLELDHLKEISKPLPCDSPHYL
jgi:hypothetical protein